MYSHFFSVCVICTHFFQRIPESRYKVHWLAIQSCSIPSTLYYDQQTRGMPWNHNSSIHTLILTIYTPSIKFFPKAVSFGSIFLGAIISSLTYNTVV